MRLNLLLPEGGWYGFWREFRGSIGGEDALVAPEAQVQTPYFEARRTIISSTRLCHSFVALHFCTQCVELSHSSVWSLGGLKHMQARRIIRFSD